jgi:hypothetical protein
LRAGDVAEILNASSDKIRAHHISTIDRTPMLKPEVKKVKDIKQFFQFRFSPNLQAMGNAEKTILIQAQRLSHVYSTGTTIPITLKQNQVKELEKKKKKNKKNEQEDEPEPEPSSSSSSSAQSRKRTNKKRSRSQQESTDPAFVLTPAKKSKRVKSSA